MGPRRGPLLWGFGAVLLQLAVLSAGQRPQDRPPRPAGWSPAPSSSWGPTLEPGAPGDSEGSAAALAFLRTGDAERLARANCSGAVSAGAAGPAPPPALRAALRAAPEALAHAANFLNMLFQTNDIREASVAEDVEWYQALVRSLAEGHPWVRRAVLALDAHPLAPKPRLMLQATKGDGQLLLQDVSSAAPSLGNLSWDNEWFNALKAQRVPALRKRVLSNDLRSLETPKWQRGDSYVGDPGHVRWSPPFLECREGQFLPTWVVTLSSAFYGLKPDLSPEFKGVVRVDVELRDVAIDQCSSGPGWFSDTHRCDLNSTQESRGFVLGRYLCRCKPGFYGAGGVASGARAGAAGPDGVSRLRCQPCRPGCATCEDDTPCLTQEDPALRAAVLSCQSCCMLAIFLSMLVSYHFRRSKRIRTSGIILLETILFGSLLLYFPVFILYFKPSIFRCIVLRWVRMLGFAIVYGTITLKLYRVLKVFLSRSAQRAPYVSSGRVLRMLAPMLLLVLWFLAAWTMGMLENSHRNIPLVIRAQTARGLHFSICGHDCWDYMMVIAEMLFLLWGSFLCYATRAVPSAFHEPRYMGIALHNELMVSAAFHVVRFLIVPSLHPDWTLLLFFAHTHGTITMTLALLFIPKFLHTGSPLREEITAEVYEDELDMRRSGSCMNSSIASAWSEHSLDPDDIREELKKLYRQLEVHKTWRMATNNPHLAKKRSSRRSLARSILRRSGAELAESSAGERPGSSSRRSSSAKRLVEAGGTSLRMRDESSRRRSSALRKSRSSEAPPREPRRGSRSPSPPEEPPPPAVMEPEQSDSDSLDAAPLLYKSASAQNLAGHLRRPPGRAPPLQKSHSVVTGAREVALLAARRDEWHGGRHLSARATTVPSDTATAQSPAERGSQEDVAPLGDAKGHKHVTYGPVKSVSVDSAHPARRVRVTVKKTPPPPPVRYQSLQRSGTLGDGSEAPPGPPAQAGEAEGTAGDEPERASPPAGKGRVMTPSASSAHVCPWELVQEEILSRKQKAAEAAESGTAGDTAATSPGPKPPSQKSFRSLGLAIKALNRSRGKSILKGKSEGSLRKRGSSRREKSGPAEAKSPEGSGQSLALQHNNNAAIPGEAAGWGDSGTAGQWDSLAPGTGDGDKAAEEPGAARGDAGSAGGLEPPSEGHQGAEHPAEVARLRRQDGDEAPAVDLGEDIPGVTGEEGTLEQLEGTSRSLQPREQPEEEQPPAKAAPSSVRGAAGAKVCPPGIPAGRGALLRQEAIAAREDGGIPESPDNALGKGSGQPEPQRGPGRSWSGAGSAQGELGAGGTRGDSSSKPGICAGKGREGDSQRSAGMEKPPELPRVALEQAEGSRAEVCPWESREQGRSVRAEICPWDTEGARPEHEGQGSPKSGNVEQPGMGLAGKPAALPKPSWQRAGTMDSKKANICPWEGEEEPRPKTEICPWEEVPAPSGKERWRQDTWGTSKGEEKVGSKASEKGKQAPAKALPKSPSGKSQSSEKAEICPWESQDLKSGDKAEICPWESQDSKSSDKAEICPWEGAEPQLEKGTAAGKKRLPGKEETKALEKGSRDRVSIRPWESQDRPLDSTDRVSICPWESPDTEQPPAKPQTGSSELPKTAPGKSPSTESLRAEICPWESQDLKSTDKVEICPWESQDSKSSDKAEICPWEVDEPQLEKGTGSGKEILPGREASKALDQSSRESICPWESPDTEQPLTKPHSGSSALPKTAPGKSHSSEKAEICPWEVESSSKAEICPWEVAAPQVEKGTGSGKEKLPGKEKTKALEMGSKERESICPWESPDMGQTPTKSQTGSSALPKTPSAKSQSTESLRAEICPWESQDSKSSDKAEICPWEVDELQLEKGTAPGKERLPGREASKALEKGSRERESICPWESQDSKSSDKAEICLWEVVAHQLEKTATPDMKRHPRKEASKALEKGSRERESISPWESLDTEQALAKTRTGSSELPKAPSGKSQSTESLRAEICPWESQDSKSIDKAEICPWEGAEAQLEKGTAPGKERLPGREASKALEKGSRERESICPWESQDTEQPLTKPQTGSSELLKAAPWKSQSTESLRAEICPWESQDLKSSDKAEICPWESQDSKTSDKAEICPWEVAAPQVEKGTGSGKEKLPGKEASKALEKGSRERESISPWESLDTEQALAKTRTGSSELPKAPSGKSQSTESLRAEICPWESQDSKSSDKAEICPWEGAEAPSQQPKAKQVPAGGSKGDKRITRQAALASPDRSLDSRDRVSICPWESQDRPLDSTDRVSICPWESPDTEQPPAKPQTGSSELPKAPSAKSQSTESLRAEICPWESQDSKSSDKAEICPWEGAAPQVEKGTGSGKEKLPGKEKTKALEMGSIERESICPWESPDTEQPLTKPQTGSSALPKTPSAKSQSTESLRAEICPWESQDSKSSDKAEICPWEVDELQLEKGTAAGKERLPGREASKALEKGSRERESICPWESQDSKSSDKAEICLWEVVAHQLEKTATPDTKRRPRKEASKALEKGSRERESISPWESLDTEQALAKTRTGSSELPKVAPGKSQSTESLRAEICPWESQDSKSIDKAEICPWEGAEAQLEKGTAPGKERLPGREASKALEKGSRERESICPWESQDTEQPLTKPQTGSSELPKAAPGKSQSTESLRAEICPWESQDSKSSDKAEICPWEGAEAPSLQPKAKQVPAGGSKGDKRITRQAALASPDRSLDSRDRVSICPWESQDRPLDSTDRVSICPWESQDRPLDSTDRVSICPWESPDTEQSPTKPQTGSSELPKAAPGKSQSTESLRAEICPWESQDSKSSDKAEICPWEVAALQVEKGTGSGKEKLPGKEKTKALEMGSRERESICPWESLDMGQTPTKSQTGSSALPKTAPGKSHSSEKAEICPWEVESSDKAEICPWEGAEPQLQKGTGPSKEKPPSREGSKALEKGSRDRESICPWESLDTEELSLKTAVGKEPSKKPDSTDSRKSEICPWEAAEPLGSEEEISQPGVQPQGAHRASPAVSPTLVEKSRGTSPREAKHKPLCRLQPSVQQPGVGSSSSPSTGLAEVCPWEAAEAPSAPAKPSSDPRRSSEVCPWEEESTDPSGSCPGQGRAGGRPRDGGGV